jgi:hypothetical protein
MITLADNTAMIVEAAVEVEDRFPRYRRYPPGGQLLVYRGYLKLVFGFIAFYRFL